MEWLAHARGAIDVGDVLDVLRLYPDGYFDAVLTDPPYGLSAPPDMAEVLAAWLAGKPYVHGKAGFMGKAWDAFVPGPEVWREVYRVLKPGGHVMAFAGSRTHDLMTLAIRLAGFEIRDALMWLYGTGFPKSMAIDKAIDKRKDWASLRLLQGKVKAAREAMGISQSEAARRAGLIGPDERLAGGGYIWFETGFRLPTREQYPGLKAALGLDDECDLAFEEAEHEVVGFKSSGIGAAFGDGEWASGPAEQVAITIPATEAASTWQGYGTTLKPGHEPITLGMKPLAGTYAENALAHGVAGLNIDGGRLPTTDSLGGGRLAGPTDMSATCGGPEWDRPWMKDHEQRLAHAARTAEKVAHAEAAGRWPPNVLVDEHVAADLAERARYFYVAKPGRPERDAGLAEHADRTRHRVNPGGLATDPRWAPVTAKNHHPTVKPIDLARQLAVLLLPPARPDGQPRRLLVTFSGSGSEIIGAVLAGWDEVIGIERDPEYAAIAVARVNHHAALVESQKA